VVFCSYGVHEAIRTGDRVAARFTIHVDLQRGRKIATEVYLFGELAQEGPNAPCYQPTRDVSHRSRGERTDVRHGDVPGAGHGLQPVRRPEWLPWSPIGPSA
jgi:hypothetical protein